MRIPSLEKCGERLEKAWESSFPLDTDRLQEVVKVSTEELRELHDDFTRLRSEAHDVIEATRGRIMTLQVI